MVNAENDDQVVSGFSVRKVRLFRNGDAYTRGKKVIVTPKIYKNFEQLLYNVSNDIKLVNGAVRKIYDLEGRAVLSLDDLQEGGSYIAAGNEPFRKVLYKLKEDEKNSSLSSLERLSGVKPTPGGQKYSTSQAQRGMAQRRNKRQKKAFASH